MAAYRDLTPNTVEPSEALVTLNGFVTFVTLGGAVPFHPEMMHYLRSEGERRHTGKERSEKGNTEQKNKIYKGTSDIMSERERERKTEPKQTMPCVTSKQAHSANQPCLVDN